MGGDVSTEPVVLYLSFHPKNYSNVYFFPVLHPHVIGSYFSSCNGIDNHNRMCKSDLELYKYWVAYTGYFRLETRVSLGMGMI